MKGNTVFFLLFLTELGSYSPRILPVHLAKLSDANEARAVAIPSLRRSKEYKRGDRNERADPGVEPGLSLG